MAEDIDIAKLSHEEALLVSFWKDVIKHVKRDIANIWTDEVRKDFERIKGEASKIALILRNLSNHYLIDIQRYKKEIYDIKMLLEHINKLEANEKWVRMIHNDLQRIISDVEKEKAELNSELSNELVNERLARLKELGLDVENQREIALLLANNWNYTENVISETGKNSVYIFSYGIPLIKHLLTEDTWPIFTKGFIRMAKEIGSAFSFILKYTLPALNHIISINTWPMIVDGLIKVDKSIPTDRNKDDWRNKYDFFSKDMPSIAYLINENNFSNVFKALELVGYFAPWILQKTGIFTRDCFTRLGITEEALPKLIAEFRELTGSFPADNEQLIRSGFEAINPLINKNTWPEITRTIKEAGINSLYIFKSLELLKGVIREENLKEFTVPLVYAFKTQGHIIYDLLTEICFIAKEDNYKSFMEFLIKISEEVKNMDNYLKFIKLVKKAITSLESLYNIHALYQGNLKLIWYLIPLRVSERILQGVQSPEELALSLSKVENILKNERAYWTVQGLNKLGFLCVHVTNAFVGSGTGHTEGKSDPFLNIENDIENKFEYNSSSSIIKPGSKWSVLVSDHLFGGKMGGSIGVIYDYGYIYEFNEGNAVTEEKRGGKYSYRSGYRIDSVAKSKGDYTKEFSLKRKKSKISDIALSLNYPKIGHYPKVDRHMARLLGPISELMLNFNEALIRKWTVAGIFYTKGCKDEVIQRLKQISDKMSFKEYINGEYWYRTTKFGVPQKVIKVFPVYEINLKTNTWTEVYRPESK